MRPVDLGAALCAGFLLALPTAVVAAVDAAEPTPVLAYYYIWFDERSWQRAKTDYPLLGRYSSDDRTVMERHVSWAKMAGIDGFIVSWKSTDALDRRLEQLIDVASKQGFHLWIIYQGLDFDRRPLPVERVLDDLQLFLASYADHPVFGPLDRPVVIWSGTWQFSHQDIAAVRAELGERLYLLATERKIDGYLRVADVVDGNAYYWSSVNPDTFPDYPERLASMGREIHRHGGLWVAPAAPGFDARLVGGTRVVPRNGGMTFQQQLDAAVASEPDAIAVISWNEFSENTHIEPSLEHGYEAVNILASHREIPPPEVFDFDSSAPGSTTGSSLPSLILITGFLLLVGSSLLVLILRSGR